MSETKKLTKEQKAAVRQYWLSRMERDRLREPFIYSLLGWATALIFSGFVGFGAALGMGAELSLGLCWGVFLTAVACSSLLIWLAGYEADRNKPYEEKKKAHEKKWRWLIDE